MAPSEVITDRAPLDRQGRHQEATDHAQHAYELFRAVGHASGEARALGDLGWHFIQLGDPQRAISACERALAQHREQDNQSGAAAILDTIGDAHHHLRNHRQAITYLGESLDLTRALDDLPHVAEVLVHLGDAHHAAGEDSAAGDRWREALNLLIELEHPDANVIRVNLDDHAPRQ